MKRFLLLSAAALSFGITGTATFASRDFGTFAQTPDLTAPLAIFDMARKGADDGAGHDAGDDKGRRGRGKDDNRLARNGADDGPGHDAGDDHGGRGRGGDDSRGHGNDDDGTSGGGHGGRERVPGGSGCDDAGDVAEHASCGA